MKQAIIEQKTNMTDGALVAGGGAYVMMAEHLPIIIGILTAILFAGRIIIAIQEYKINRKVLEKSDKADEC